MDVVPLLTRFGLTHQEAKLYRCLHSCREATGYELAKTTGISRSNVYASLASLAEKGGAYIIAGNPSRYCVVSIDEFCNNVIRGLEQAKDILKRRLPAGEEPESAYLTIRGARNIADKIESLMEETQYRIYLSMDQKSLRQFLPSLQTLNEKGTKVVIISDAPVPLPGAKIYLSNRQPGHIRLISDSMRALTGELDDTPHCTCLYSLKENLVELLKDSIKNEIRLIELSGGNVE